MVPDDALVLLLLLCLPCGCVLGNSEMYLTYIPRLLQSYCITSEAQGGN